MAIQRIRARLTVHQHFGTNSSPDCYFRYYVLRRSHPSPGPPPRFPHITRHPEYSFTPTHILICRSPPERLKRCSAALDQASDKLNLGTATRRNNTNGPFQLRTRRPLP